MPAPAVGVFTQRLYDRLPELYTAADPATSYTLLRYLSLLGDQASTVENLVNRFGFVPQEEGGPAGGTADLVDPATADAAWLPWLAQLVGVRLDNVPTVAAQRAAIAGASSGWQAGTLAGIAAAAKPQLTGTQTIAVSRTGTWTLNVLTIPAETPDQAAMLAAIEAAQARPAGFTLTASTYAASWDLLEGRYPTWSAWDAVATWAALESTT